MSTQRDECSWLQYHFITKICHMPKCKYCDYTTDSVILQKLHLYRKHSIFHEKDRKKWKNDANFLWIFFTKEELFAAKCKINNCGAVLKSAYNLNNVWEHLTRHNISQVTDVIVKKIATSPISKHVRINKENNNIECSYCQYTNKIYNGIESFTSHLTLQHNIHVSKSQVESMYNNLDTITQSVAEEDSSSHYNTNRFKQRTDSYMEGMKQQNVENEGASFYQENTNSQASAIKEYLPGNDGLKSHSNEHQNIMEHIISQSFTVEEQNYVLKVIDESSEGTSSSLDSTNCQAPENKEDQ